MPPVCIFCGRPVATFVSKQFIVRPKWASIGFFLLAITLIPALVVLIVGAIRTRRMTVDCPVCERHRNYWGWRGFWVYAPIMVLALSTVVLAVLAVNERISNRVFAFFFLGLAFLLLLWALAASIIQRTSLKAIEITDDDITLDRVHAKFLDQVRTGRAQSKVRSGLEGWEDYDPYPRGPA
jgi:hypothetical protein